MCPILGVRDDPLLFLYSSTGLRIYKQSRLLRIVFISTQFLMTSVILICLISIFLWKSSPIFMCWQYLPFVGLFSLGTLSNIIMIFLYPHLTELPIIIRKHAWCYKSGDAKIQSRIMKSCKFVKVLHIVSIPFLTLFIMSNILPGENDESWQAPLYLINKYSGRWRPLMITMQHFLGSTIVFSCLVNLNICNYAMCHIILQYHLLNHYVIRLVKYSMQRSDEDDYQEAIYQKIMNISRMHIQIKKFCKMMLIFADVSFIALSLASFQIIISVGAFIIFKIHPESNLRMCMILIPTIIFNFSFCTTGQRTVDESQNVYNNALKCGWYNWNTKNRRVYLIFLLNNLKPLSFTSSGISDVDLRLLVNIYKFWYSLLTLFLKLNGKGNNW